MKRPIGITLSSIALGSAAICLLFMTVLIAFAGIASTHRPSPAQMLQFARYTCLGGSIFFAALAVWAILTIIGILRLRSWARYSILVIGGGVAAIGIFGVLGILLTKSMLSNQQLAVDPHILTVVFLVMAAIYLLIAAVGIWWLIYFNLRPIRELFLGASYPGISALSNHSDIPRRPTAITILGWLLLASAICCGLCALLPLPAFILGFILSAKASHALYLIFALIAAFAGYGLLKLNEIARLTAIGFLLFGCFNLTLACLPWYRAQFFHYATQLTKSLPTYPGQSSAMFPYTAMILFNTIFGIVFNAVLLWLLHKNRNAFLPPPPPPPMLEA